MSLLEVLGCTFIAFGPSFAILICANAKDPTRIIIIIATAFFWVLTLSVATVLWFTLEPLRQFITFGVVLSVLVQEIIRYAIYRILRRKKQNLPNVMQIMDDITEQKHTFACVCGLCVSITFAVFGVVNVLADMLGPDTIGLKGDIDIFAITLTSQALSILLLQTFWCAIFFNALDTRSYLHIGYMLGSQLFVSLMTLLYAKELYLVTLLPNYLVTILTGLLAYNITNGSMHTFMQYITCQ